MKIYLVASTATSWMNGGYGHALLAGEHPQALVSYLECLKDLEKEPLRVTCMTFPYQPKEPKNEQ